MTNQTTANILTTAGDLFGITAIDINNLTSRSTWSTAEAIEALPENVHRLTQQGSLQAGCCSSGLPPVKQHIGTISAFSKHHRHRTDGRGSGIL